MKIFLLVLSILVISQAQVLGIDFGTEFWKASLISPGKNLVIVENSRSQRKTINGISIQQGVRHFEIDALYKRLKKPQTSYFYLNKLLRSLDFENPLEGYEFANGTYFITHEEQKISLEQLVAMILKNVKIHASLQAGSEIKDAVLAIPPSWGWKSRMALLNAASIASLSVLGLVNENSAAAINFAITRNDTDPINIGFFNLGSNNLQFSIMQFFGYKDEVKGKNIESLKVLSHIVVEDVGGLQVDKAIADHLSEKFLEKHKLDPRKNKKGYTKLLHEAAEAKETLSANKQTQVYVEGIMEGIDLNLHITREIVQKLDVFQNLHQHLDKALEKAGISKSELNSVELIGGASRIPLVSKIVKEHFDGIEVGSHINGDEAMAFGASLRAANLSITFRVKQLHFYDGFEKDIRCVVSSGDKTLQDKILFTKDSQHGENAILQLSPPESDIKVDLFYGEELVKSYVSQNITAWRDVYNESTYNFSSDPNLVLGFVISTTNIVDLKESYVNLTFNQTDFKTVDDWIEEDVKTEEQNNQTQTNKEETTDKTEQNTEEKKEENDEQKPQEQTQEKNQTPEQTSQNQKNSEQATNQTQTQSTDNENKSQQDKNQTKKTKKAKTPKKKLVKVSKIVLQSKIQTKKHQVKTEQTFVKYPRFSKSDIQQKQQILLKFERNEKYLKEKSKIRNDLESTLYRLKDSYEEPYLVKFSKEAELENLKKVVSQKLQWLDENAWTAEKDDFEKQYNEVFDAYRPMYNRSNEYSDRQQKYNETIEYLSFTYQKTLELNSTHSWLGDKVVRHLKKINETVKVMHEKLKKQHDQPINEDPILYNHEMINMAENLRDEYYLLKMTPRPKPAKKVKIQVENEAKPVQTEEKENEQAGSSEQASNEQAKGQTEESEPSNEQTTENKTENPSSQSQNTASEDLNLDL